MEDIERAKRAIDQYCMAEFGVNADFTSLDNVPILYSTVGDDEDEIQWYADLLEGKMKCEINGELAIVDDFVLEEFEDWADHIFEWYYGIADRWVEDNKEA